MGNITFASSAVVFPFVKIQILFSEGGFLGMLSAPSPLKRVRYSTSYYYTDNNIFPPVKDLLNDSNVTENAMHPIARVVCKVCLLYFCRISEVLSLRVSDILKPDRVVCRGSKRGSGYVIYLPGISQQVLSPEVLDVSALLFPISYLKCYRSFQRAGIRLARQGYKNNAVCHAGRYQVNKVSPEVMETFDLGDLLHHKSKSSILYYLNEGRNHSG